VKKIPLKISAAKPQKGKGNRVGTKKNFKVPINVRAYHPIRTVTKLGLKGTRK